MPTNSSYRPLFLGLAAFIMLLFASAFVLMSGAFFMIGGEHSVGVHRLSPFFLLIIAYVGVVGLLTHRDAIKQEMNPWLWASVAAFTPYLVGVIIYLVVRSNTRATCLQCGESSPGRLQLCPYCGAKRGLSCEACGQRVEADWNVCPQCGEALARPSTSPVESGGQSE